MLGPHDGLCIFDAANSVTAGAVSVAVGSTGSFKHLETHELLTQDGLRLAGERSRVQAQLSAAASAGRRLVIDGFSADSTGTSAAAAWTHDVLTGNSSR